ncbi:hypothetical protein CSUI_003431 [Cystoisospora suis]|uniref:Uncharacterized protein n=1 Tax=Cystoisospora suis TaxID=483139 RepID=A0A2C6L5K2_9APIC|nr:hypothetical protein CSUI_003431 [Cystoisospora suis]
MGRGEISPSASVEMEASEASTQSTASSSRKSVFSFPWPSSAPRLLLRFPKRRHFGKHEVQPEPAAERRGRLLSSSFFFRGFCSEAETSFFFCSSASRLDSQQGGDLSFADPAISSAHCPVGFPRSQLKGENPIFSEYTQKTSALGMNSEKEILTDARIRAQLTA